MQLQPYHPPQPPPTLQVPGSELEAWGRAPVRLPHPSTGQPESAGKSCFAKHRVCRRHVGGVGAPWLSVVPSRPVLLMQEESKPLCTAVTSHPPPSNTPSSPRGS